jgi:hypothetical protein
LSLPEHERRKIYTGHISKHCQSPVGFLFLHEYNFGLLRRFPDIWNLTQFQTIYSI